MKLAFACGKDPIEVTNLFNNFQWVWSNMPKVSQINKLEWT